MNANAAQSTANIQLLIVKEGRTKECRFGWGMGMWSDSDESERHMRNRDDEWVGGCNCTNQKRKRQEILNSEI